MKVGSESNWKVGASRIFLGPWPTVLSQVINILNAPRHLGVFKRKQTVYLGFQALNIRAFVKEGPWGGFVVRWHLSTLQSWSGLAKDVFTGSSEGVHGKKVADFALSLSFTESKKAESMAA